MSTINARLKRVHLQSPQPQQLAEFYGRAYALDVSQRHGTYLCQRDGRQVAVSIGTAGQVHNVLFAFSSPADWQAFQQRTSKLPHADAARFSELPAGSLCFEDPEGHVVAFCLDESPAPRPAPEALAGYTQHCAFRTLKIAEMVRFYTESLGLELSDNVRDEAGDLRACFLRSDALHHCLALFKAPVSCFDHQAFESPDWENLKQWADHL